MKTKVINVSWPEELEKPLNEFLELNPDITILRTDYHSNIRDERHTNFPEQIANQFYEFTCIVFYKEKGCEDQNVSGNNQIAI